MIPLFILLPLLFAVPVGAGDKSLEVPVGAIYLEGRPCTVVSEDMRGKIVASCGLSSLKGDLLVDVFPDPCLAKMEAAMRAMDKYFLRDTNAVSPGFLDAEKLWHETKRECWSK